MAETLPELDARAVGATRHLLALRHLLRLHCGRWWVSGSADEAPSMRC